MKKNPGMWIFLATEAVLFGTILLLFQYFYFTHHAEMREASRLLHFPQGTINTAILLTSSLCVAQAEFSRKPKLLLLATLLGFIFIGIKASEYAELIHAGHFPLFFRGLDHTTELFLGFYACLTILHLIHVALGMIAMIYVYKTEKYEREVGLYWHFVDIVWVFLYPLFYLARQV